MESDNNVGNFKLTRMEVAVWTWEADSGAIIQEMVIDNTSIYYNAPEEVEMSSLHYRQIDDKYVVEKINDGGVDETETDLSAEELVNFNSEWEGHLQSKPDDPDTAYIVWFISDPSEATNDQQEEEDQ
jgi:hypothetical protein